MDVNFEGGRKYLADALRSTGVDMARLRDRAMKDADYRSLAKLLAQAGRAPMVDRPGILAEARKHYLVIKARHDAATQMLEEALHYCGQDKPIEPGAAASAATDEASITIGAEPEPEPKPDETAERKPNRSRRSKNR